MFGATVSVIRPGQAKGGLTGATTTDEREGGGSKPPHPSL